MNPTRYPIFIPSKGRSDMTYARTGRQLMQDHVPFRVVVEPQEAELYAETYGEARVLVLPFSNLGQGSIPARNWILDRAKEEGADRLWMLDDNIKEFRRLYRGRRIPCDAGVALRAAEELIDRYENVPIGGLNYQMFVPAHEKTPFRINVHVYSCMLIAHRFGLRFRGRYNEDTDYCLQALADGHCTILINVFMANKERTMLSGGGNSAELYAGDGRLAMARELERRWPGVVKTDRRWGRPQHVVNWRRFDTPLIRRPDVDLEAMPAVDEGGSSVRAIREVKSDSLRAILDP